MTVENRLHDALHNSPVPALKTTSLLRAVHSRRRRQKRLAMTGAAVAITAGAAGVYAVPTHDSAAVTADPTPTSFPAAGPANIGYDLGIYYTCMERMGFTITHLGNGLTKGVANPGVTISPLDARMSCLHEQGFYPTQVPPLSQADVVDHVSVGGLPKGWQAVSGAAPLVRHLYGGTRTRHDLVCLAPASCEALMVMVYRNTDVEPAIVATTLTYGDQTGVLEAGSNAEQGIALFAGQDLAAGYKRISPTLFLVVRAAPLDLPKILASSGPVNE